MVKIIKTLSITLELQKENLSEKLNMYKYKKCTDSN